MAARRETVPLIVLALLLLRPDDAAAQAWLPEKGNFSLTAAVSDNFNKKHYLPDGEEIDVGHTRTNIVAFSFSYGMTDRLTVTAGIPYVQGKYDGPRPHPTAVDDGDYHGSVTDVHLGLHFQALDEPFALAPYSTVVIPVRDYETLGHAAPGRGLEELWFGFYAGKSLDLWIPRTYIQGRYNYAFVEKVAGVAHDRSNADLEIGYFLSPEWSIRAVVSAVETHGGIPVPVPPTHPLFDFHDQLAAESLLNVGAGASWSMSDRIDIYALYLRSVRGKSGHKLDLGLTLGFSYGLFTP